MVPWIRDRTRGRGGRRQVAQRRGGVPGRGKSMPTRLSLTPVALPPEDVPAAAERFTRTLVGLTRTVWHPDCTFDSALAAICAAAADALLVERVTAWRHDAGAGELRCLFAYDRDAPAAAAADREAVLPLAEYAE